MVEKEKTSANIAQFAVYTFNEVLFWYQIPCAEAVEEK